MRKDIHKKGEPKARYRVKNWAAYNEGLINRGNVTIWINEAVFVRIPDAIPARGRPCLYGDTLIQALLGVKTVYRLTLRALQGFTQSLGDLWLSLACRCRMALLHKSSMRTQWNGLRTSLVRNPFVPPETMPVDAIASSRSIY
ncbi:MAG: hypothetical protein E5299_00284 [Burkholderia gladioli]|nr:MAG: hypothetical protein E5299_00284 [Burkholderia gladioli]